MTTLLGTQGADLLQGGSAADEVYGLDGDDTLSGGAGVNKLDGGAGVDTVTYEWLTLTNVTLILGNDFDIYPGAKPNFALGYDDNSLGYYVQDTLNGIENAIGTKSADDLIGSPVSNRLEGREGDDYISGLGGDDVLIGGAGLDRLRGGDGNDSISGGEGFDDINGNRGADTGSGGAGDDWVAGGQDNDLLNGDDGNDVVYGNLGSDTVRGGTGDDIVRGGQGNDLIEGGAGNDWLSGDLGDDTVSGGPGADTFYFFAGAGSERITDFSYAEGDLLFIDRPGFYASQQGADTLIRLEAGDTLTLVGVNLATLPSDYFYTSLGRFRQTTPGDDIIRAGDYPDIIPAFGGTDRVLGFAVGDHIQIGYGETYSLTQVGPDSVITLGNGSQVILIGVSASTLGGDWMQQLSPWDY